MNKKGQAALEFLMTYGWAILVVIAIIAAFFKFGLLDAEMLSQQKCMMEVDGLTCTDWVVSSDSALIRFENNLQRDINITNIYLIPEGESVEGVVCAGSLSDGGDAQVIKAGKAASMDIADTEQSADCNMQTLDGKVKFQMNVEYYVLESGPAFRHNSTGTLLAKIEGTD